MRNFYVFDIPVYLCDKSSYDAKMDKAVEECLTDTFEARGLARTTDIEQLIRIRERARVNFGGRWQYNQIVGWIRLFIEGGGVGGHLWWVNTNLLRRKMRRTFEFRTASNALATWLPDDADSGLIFKRTLEAVEGLSKVPEFKGRYIDLSVFRRVGPFIDWRGLMAAVNQ
jgi:hypothetical protein